MDKHKTERESEKKTEAGREGGRHGQARGRSNLFTVFCLREERSFTLKQPASLHLVLPIKTRVQVHTQTHYDTLLHTDMHTYPLKLFQNEWERMWQSNYDF